MIFATLNILRPCFNANIQFSLFQLYLLSGENHISHYKSPNSSNSNSKSTLWALEKDEVELLFLVQQYRMNCAPNTSYLGVCYLYSTPNPVCILK